ncbi:glycoside hydrolase family 127 protein [Hymenobacter sp. HSC-4F20]|nr:glycoside hydrolase family 127 protein [Hymenobacter sp. HSC-4F20]
MLGSLPARSQAAPGSAGVALVPLQYTELPLGAIRPQGWLRQQLLIMNQGATGHLDEFFPKLRDDNGWLGGKGDNWEETPYWLDGAVPLAYLLNDARLQAKVQKYIHWTLTTQRPSGYFGPLTKAEQAAGHPLTIVGEQGEDWWPRMVMLKVLKQYYQATQDARVLPFMTRYFHYQLQTLPAFPLVKWSEWSRARGGDNLELVYWLYRQTGDAQLLQLGDLLTQQTTPWTRYLGGRDWVMQAAANQTGEQWMDRHGVNVGQGLKLPVVRYQATGDPQDAQALRTGWLDLMTLHGLPMGIFSADEDLHGNLPTQGTELCAIVETMYSLEQAIAITGELLYMDALERMTYNALPTQTAPDFQSRQYFQVANQVQVARGVYDFSLPFERGMNNVFGPYAGYTCCTSNQHQGWTKFTSHLWYATPTHGLAALEYAPNVLTTTVASNVPVTVREETNYPFEEQVRFVVETKKKVAFPLALRIPGWCPQATLLLNGQPLRSEKGGQVVTLNREWKNKDVLTLQLPMPLTTSRWGRNSRAVERGPLVYALKVPHTQTKGRIQEEGDYYEFRPAGPWNYGLPKKLIEQPEQHLTVRQTPWLPDQAGTVWSAERAPVELTAPARRIPGWQLIGNVAPQPVTSREEVYKGEVSAETERITLIPYGCTTLRVVAFPVVPTATEN